MPKPMHTGKRSSLAEPGDIFNQFWRKFTPLAGYSSDRNVIDKPGRRFGDANGTLARRGGRNQLNQTEIGGAANFRQRRRFFDKQIGHDRTGNSGAAAVIDILLQSMTINNSVADHRHNRRSELRNDTACHFKNLEQLDFVLKCPGVRCLDYRSIGNGIAVRNSEFAHCRAALHELTQHGGSELQIWIARRDERHQCLAAFAFQLGEKIVDFRHVFAVRCRF